MRAYRAWRPQWDHWAAAERTARPRRRLRKELARTARQLSLNDDAMELVAALGLLTWDSPGGHKIQRHILTVRLSVTVDPRTSRLTVNVLDDALPQLEDRYFLQRDDGFLNEQIRFLRDQLDHEPPALLSTAMIDLLRGWQERALEQAGRFSETWDRPEDAGATPLLTLSPALIVRPRDRNRLVDYYESIQATLRSSDAQCPLGLAQLLLPLNTQERLAWRTRSHRAADQLLSDDPLFPLPVNQAQAAVFERLRRDTAIVLQGPPGTGKTHTIANLLAALLADGKRVLVTSAKDQALDVLADDDMLPPQLRNLCIRLTNQRGTGREETERTIRALSDNAATRNPTQLRAAVNDLQDQRAQLRRRISQLHRQVTQLREAETLDHGEVAPGYAGTRAEIGERVRRAGQLHGWIAMLPASGPPAPPLDAVAALELLQLLRSETMTRRRPLGQWLPAPAGLPTPEQFEQLVEAARPSTSIAGHDQLAGALGRLADADFIELERRLQVAVTALQRMGMPQQATAWPSGDWRTRALRDALTGRARRLWQKAAQTTQQVQRHRDNVLALEMAHVQAPTVDGPEAAAMAAALTDLCAYLDGGGRLRRVMPHRTQRVAEEAMHRSRVNGRPPQTTEELRALIIHLQAASALAAATAHWVQLGVSITHHGTLLVGLEEVCNRSAPLGQVEAFADAHAAINDLLITSGMPQAIHDQPHWDAFARSMRLVKDQAAVQRARARIDAWAAHCRPASPDSEPAPEAAAVGAALRGLDPYAYARALPGLRQALRDQTDSRRQRTLLQALGEAAPGLVERLQETRHEPVWEQRLGALDAAWGWARAAAFLSQTTPAGHERQVEAALDEAEGRLQRLTAELAAEKAWQQCLERMTQHQRQALQTFKNRMSDLGKGTSRRYAGRHRAAVREAMEETQAAVPAWIMPLDLVVATVPPIPDSFDVVIIDEASQLRVDAAFLLWLAPHVIVVGDDQQCSPPPSSFGELEPIFDRLDDYLPNVKLSRREDFSPKSNLYRLMETRFPDTQRLTDHYRCMPEIIGWSSANFYDKQLVALREYGVEQARPAPGRARRRRLHRRPRRQTSQPGRGETDCREAQGAVRPPRLPRQDLRRHRAAGLWAGPVAGPDYRPGTAGPERTRASPLARRHPRGVPGRQTRRDPVVHGDR